MLEGKLLGHIISKDGIKIDPTRVEAIQNIGFLRSKKEVQSFLGKVNVLRRFIPNFAEIVKVATNVLKKENIIKWTIEAKQSFAEIKHALTKDPVLISLDFSKKFLFFNLPQNIRSLVCYCIRIHKIWKNLYHSFVKF